MQDFFYMPWTEQVAATKNINNMVVLLDFKGGRDQAWIVEVAKHGKIKTDCHHILSFDDGKFLALSGSEAQHAKKTNEEIEQAEDIDQEDD